MNNIEVAAIQVIYQDAHLWVVSKPPGISVQPDRRGDRSLLHLARLAHPGRDVGSPHRVDRPVSGLVVFTLNAAALRGMDLLFREQRILKTYLAVVEGATAPQGTLAHRLVHKGGARKAVTVGEEAGKPVALNFHARMIGERYTLLEVEPEGGAFHQIRAQLSAAGHPIKGDVKYGARRGEKDRSIALHAWRLCFPHPITAEAMDLECPIPIQGIWRALGTAG